jgi:hypothetical protein
MKRLRLHRIALSLYPFITLSLHRFIALSLHRLIPSSLHRLIALLLHHFIASSLLCPALASPKMSNNEFGVKTGKMWTVRT